MVEETVLVAGGGDAGGPLEAFARSHAGILMRLEQLRTFARRLADSGGDRRAASEDAEAMLSFFRGLVFAHHQEEEQALFPAVVRAAARGDDVPTVAALVARLEREHRQIESDWESIEPALLRIAAGKSAAVDQGIVSRLCDRYAAHAQFEEHRFLPLAAKILDEDDQTGLALTLHMRHLRDRSLADF